MKRTVAPYGVVVAQEPNQSHFLTKPLFGQVSGISMGIMHYLYRIEHYKPVPEPPIHEYHRAFSRQELVSLFSDQFFILHFRSCFAFSCLFTKLRNSILSSVVLGIDNLLKRNEGSVFHIVCSKTDAGYRDLLKTYFRFLEQLHRDPAQRTSWSFLMILPALIMLGRIYEIGRRVKAKFRSPAC